ncbi:MAG: response regulator transcription factor [Actinomycetota bacterium]|jgi:DNA-binding NarL/FixJ family response regulator|nr:response regulator transcription factor [Rubrobacter sp.]MDQ3508240.1 response regulator transcription factor [Actinomycetota bacterium]
MQDLIATVRSVARCESEEGVIVSAPRSSFEQTGRRSEDSEGVLTRREMEVLMAVARGMSNKQAGASLHVSETTIKRHLSNIYAKLGVGSRGEAVRKAMSEGWISGWDISKDG